MSIQGQGIVVKGHFSKTKSQVCVLMTNGPLVIRVRVVKGKQASVNEPHHEKTGLCLCENKGTDQLCN